MLLKDPKKLRRLMVIQDVSGRKLAEIAGWKSHSYLQRLLKGQAKWLEIEPAVKIATFLGVDMTDLFVPKTSSDDGQIGKQRRMGA